MKRVKAKPLPSGCERSFAFVTPDGVEVLIRVATWTSIHTGDHMNVHVSRSDDERVEVDVHKLVREQGYSH